MHTPTGDCKEFDKYLAELDYTRAEDLTWSEKEQELFSI